MKEKKRQETGLCILCRNEAAMPRHDLCRDCWLEIQGEKILKRLEEKGRA